MLPFKYKIMHVISGDLWAGAEVQAFNLICALSDHGCNMSVVLFNHGILEKKLRQHNIVVNVIDENNLSALRMLLQLCKVINTQQPDIIHSHDFKENVLSAIAGKLKSNAILLRTEHGDNEFKTPWWKPHKKIQHLLNHFTATYIQKGIISVSAALGKILATRYPKEKIFVIENSINIQHVINVSEQKANTTYPTDTIKLACVGRLIPLKRQDLLLDMMTKLVKSFDNIELYLYGDGPERENLTAKQRELGLTKQVKFMGNVDPIYPHLKAMDILLMPSDHEGLPMTLLEAMALQVAIIAHAIGGIPNALNNGENGLLVYDHTAQGYFDATLNTIKNTHEKKSRTANAFKYLNQHYSIEKQVQEYDQLYLHLLNSKTRNP